MSKIHRPPAFDDLTVVAGGQFGSEAKGHVTSRLVVDTLEGGWDVLNVRVGGPNAGHTVIDDSGRAWPLRQVPVGAVHPAAQLYIGPGSEIDEAVLLSEIDQLNDAGFALGGRMFVSSEATVLTEEHKLAESVHHLIDRIGSTGKGIGAARAARLMRRADRVWDDLDLRAELDERGIRVVLDFPSAPNPDVPQSVIIEGTQGFGLGLHAGYYPFCTSGDVRAIDLMAQAGVSPWEPRFQAVRVWLVVRPNPIRVAGNSGPLVGETSWEELGLPPEYTTVTLKERRVGDWDAALVASAVRANGGSPVVRLALTMTDQVFDEVKGLDKIDDPGVIMALTSWTDHIHLTTGAPVRMITTGPATGMFW